MEFTAKRSEKELTVALEAAKANGKSERHIRNLTSALARKQAEKKAGRIEAAHKRWATRKANIAARKAAEQVTNGLALTEVPVVDEAGV